MIAVRGSFHLKLALWMMMSVMLLIALSSTVTYWKFHEIMSRRVIGDFNQLMLQNAKNIDDMINSLDKSTLLLYTDRTIMTILNKRPAEYMDTYDDVNRINGEMTKYMFVPLTSSMNVSSISFFVSPDMPFAGALNAGSDLFFGFFNGREAVSASWYRQSVEADGRLVWFRMDDQPDRLFVARLIKNPEALASDRILTGEPVIQNVGVVVIGFNLSEIARQLEASELSPSTQLIVADRSGSLIYANRPDRAIVPPGELGSRRSGDKLRYRGADYFVTRNSLQFGWQLIGLIPTGEIYKKSTVVTFIVGLSASIALLAGALLAIFVSRRISLPIRRLARTMKAIMTTEHLNVSLDAPKGNDEIGILYGSFNGMMGHIQHLMGEVYESGVRLKEAELKALQAQINPHFLYNTLDSVNWLALESGVDQIALINSSLAEMYRYAAKDAGELVTLEEEIRQVRLYMTIQSLCYPERFGIEYDIPPGFANLRCPKLILQPLVENAILHGIERTGRRGLIRLTGVIDGGMAVLSLEDNGAGADAERLNAQLEGEEETPVRAAGAGFDGPDGQRASGVGGSRNVNRRIRLKFGDRYGLRYESNDRGGLTAVIRLPAERN